MTLGRTLRLDSAVLEKVARVELVRWRRQPKSISVALLSVLLATSAMAETTPSSTESITARYLSGRVAQNAGDWGAAASNLGAVLRNDPENSGLLRRTFLLNLGEGNYAEAAALARRADDKESQSYIASLMVIADDLKTNKVADAAARLDKLPDDGLAQFVTPLLGAWVDVAKGDTEGALKRLRSLNTADGFAIMQQLQIALIEDLRNNRDAAALHYTAATERGAPLRLTLLIGNFQERAGNKDAARRIYERYQRENPGSLAVDEALARLDKGGPTPARLIGNASAGLAEALFEMSAALSQENAQEMALLYGRLSLFLDPEQPLMRLTMGDILSARQRYADALTEFAAVKGSQGLTWAARLRQAETLRLLDRRDEAAKLLNAMAAEKPTRTDALVQLGDLYRMAKQSKPALAAYDQAMARIAKPTAADWALYYARAMILDSLGNWAQAEAGLKKALELSPQQASVLNYLGYSYIDRGVTLDEGRALIEKALALRPQDGFIIDSLGWAKFKQGDFHGAVELLEQAVELEPMDPSISDHLGDVYWALGRKQEARFQWTRAAQQADNDGLRKSAQIKLKDGLATPVTASVPN
jgi:tetratricopeptide (TPR) repeat protein